MREGVARVDDWSGVGRGKLGVEQAEKALANLPGKAELVSVWGIRTQWAKRVV